MFFNFFKRGGIKRWGKEIDPDEIFLDSRNLPGFDKFQFEGRIERSITKRTIVTLGLFFALIGVGYGIKLWNLQVVDG